MPTLIICEKPSQAKHVQQALGNTRGQILPCRGHLLRLEEPEETNPNWKTWNQDLLVPPKGRYGYVEEREQGKGPLIDAISRAIKTATEVVIATDCDREGQGIGQSLVEYFGFRGTVKRAIFNAEDPVTLKAAFDKLEPNSAYEQTYQAFIARQQSDQIYNLTLTRVASTILRERGTKGVIGIGRVKTATLGIICKREREILAFKPVEYYEIKLLVAGSHEVELSYNPSDERRVVDRTVAETIAAAAGQYQGPITVSVERKRTAPPNPPDLATLQQRGNVLWDWTSKRTGEVAQDLYEMGAITYPRADTRYLKEVMIGTMQPLTDMLAQIPAYKALPLKAPIIRKGKDGVFSDKALDGISHHAIIPNINCTGGFTGAIGRMNADQAKLFDLVARSFLACIGEDYIYDTTTMHVPVPVASVDPKDPLKFSASGSIPVYRGWRAIDDANPEKQTILPALTDGEIVKAVKATIKSSKTKPPPRFSEAAVLVQMKEAWRYCPDPAEQKRLEAAKGIGTAATRDTVILGLKNQKLIVLDGRSLVPTTAGLMIYDVLLDCAKSLVDPASTARMEAMLDDILVGKTDANTVINLIAKQAQVLSQAIMRSPVRINLETATSTKKAAAEAAKAVKAAGKSIAAGKGGASPAARPGRSKAAAARGAAQAQIAAAAAQQANDRIYLEIPGDVVAQRAAYDLRAKYDATTRKWWIPKTVDATPFRAKGWLT